jgi:uncharacterized protein
MIPASLLELDLNAPLQDDELAKLDAHLVRLGERVQQERGEEADCIFDTAELDGFLLAVVSSPKSLAAEEWLPGIWGGTPPPFESQADAEAVLALILRHHNATARLLERLPEMYEPIFGYDVDEEGNEYESVEEWCVGFLRGMELAWEAWEPAMEREPQLFDVVHLFGSQEGWEERQAWSEEEVDELQEQLPDISRMLAALGLQQRAATLTFRREAAKVGRNDLCPCGSGRKYKQCCGR